MGLFSIFKKATEKEATKSPLSKESAQKILDAASDARKEEKFRIAGVSFRQDDLLKFGSSNPDYSLKPSELRKLTYDRNVYEYVFQPIVPELVPEPENEHDPNAIAVYADGVKIGYIKKGSTSRIRNIIKSRNITGMTLQIKGGNYKYFDDISERVKTEKGDFRAELIIAHEEK